MNSRSLLQSVTKVVLHYRVNSVIGTGSMYSEPRRGLFHRQIYPLNDVYSVCMSGETKRVNFNFPQHLVEQADVLGEVEQRDRTEIVVTALREYLHDATTDEQIVQEVAGAYYDGRIDFEQLRVLVGPEKAGNFRLLKQQLDEEFIHDVAESMGFE
jgi:hypothetical protein